MRDLELTEAVIEAHTFDRVGLICSCGKECGVVCDRLTYPQHLAAEVAAQVRAQIVADIEAARDRFDEPKKRMCFNVAARIARGES